MLSILIPTYNYNVYPLVKELHQQATATGIVFEILCLDDGSESDETLKNEQINSLSHCTFTVLPKNIGRSAIRNLLSRKATFQSLLFLDADVFPKNSDFIETYISHLTNEQVPSIVYGGIRYAEEKPKKEQLLRWVYGNKREALSVQERKKNPYKSFLTLNFLIHKSIFEKVRFNEEIANLRHEDTLFSFELKQKNVPVFHIENPVYHLGIESSTVFLKKSNESLVGLNELIEGKLLDKEYVKLSNYYFSLKKNKGLFFFKKIYTLFRRKIERNILSEAPNLFLFDLYRLHYFIRLRNGK